MTPTPYQIAAMAVPETENLLLADDASIPLNSKGIGKTTAAMWLAWKALNGTEDVGWVCVTNTQIHNRMDLFEKYFLFGSAVGYRRNKSGNKFYFSGRHSVFRFVTDSNQLRGVNPVLCIVDSDALLAGACINMPYADRYVVDGGTQTIPGVVGNWYSFAPSTTSYIPFGGQGVSLPPIAKPASAPIPTASNFSRGYQNFVNAMSGLSFNPIKNPRDAAPDTERSATKSCTCGVKFTGGLCSDWCDLNS